MKMSARTSKEAYFYAEDSPVFTVWPYEGAKLARVFHFDLMYHSGKIMFYMLTHFKDRENYFYRDMSSVAVAHGCYYHDFNFEKELEKFIRKVRHYTINNNSSLTRTQYREIRGFFRKRRESDKT
jgi:hypothetical protein